MFQLRKQGSWSSEMSLSSEEAKRSPLIRLRLENPRFPSAIYTSNTLNLFIPYTKASTLVFCTSTLLLPLLIVILYSYTLKPTKKWSLTSSRKVVMLALARDKKSRPSLAPSSLHRSLGSLNQARQVNTGLFTTSPTHTPLLGIGRGNPWVSQVLPLPLPM